ncbi:sensor histidine kinase [Streptomyces lavendulae]|uniref:sensor histidine kinase n=1 Tax=Streptomyces lavendulae TaxID=1914 RepID=UPI0037F76754
MRTAALRLGLDTVFGLVLLGATAVTMRELRPGVVPFSPYGAWLAVPAIALFLLRRRLPVPALLGLALILGVVPQAALLTAVAAYDGGRRLTGLSRPAALLAACTFTMATAVSWLPLDTAGALIGAGTGLMLGLIAIAGPGLVGTTVGQQERLVRALREQNHAAEGEARLAERSRIAAEMHDLLGHRLSLISLYAGGLELGVARHSPDLRSEAGQLRRTAGTAMNELREVLGVLGPLEHNPTDATGTRADIEALTADSRSAAQPVTLVWNGPDLSEAPPQVRRAVHRVVREALTNAHRHAPGAQVTVCVGAAAEEVTVRIVNALPAAEPAPVARGTGRGLLQLRERVEVLGGKLTSGPGPGPGFLVTARIPLTPDRAPAERPRPVPVRERLRLLPRLTAGLLGLTCVGTLLLAGLSVASRYATAARESEAARETAPATVSPPAEARLGMDREEVEHMVDDNGLARAAAAGREPPRRAGTDCLYPAQATTDMEGGLHLVRYCFTDNRLTEIKRFTLPLESP